MMIVLPSLERLAQKTLAKDNEAGVNQGLTIAHILQRSGPAQREWAVYFGIFRWRGQHLIDTHTLQEVVLR
jgi:hypothetical protein